MQNSLNSNLSYDQDELEQVFENINYLIDNDKLDSAQEKLLSLHYADLADFLDNTNHKLYSTILSKIVDKLNPETIVCLNDSSKQPILESIGIKKSAEFINRLDIEDAIEVIENIDEELKQQIFGKLTAKKRQQIIEGFNYPENTVGRVLEKNFISFQVHWTVGQAIDYIRRSNISQDFHAAIIVNSKDKPVGNILLSTLLKSSRTKKLREIMNSEFKIAATSTELDELAFIFKQYALTIVPVVNKKGKLVGTVSIDNMLYIIEEQTESELMHLGGVNTSDIYDSFYVTAKQRFPWLFVHLITACANSLIINQFGATIAKLITLATIFPIVASMGGSAGTQVMTVTIRALVNREIISTNIVKIILKEILVCAVNGILLAFIGGIVSYLLFADSSLSTVFAVAVVINFTIAGLIGSGIPIFLNSKDIDPAAASGVFVNGLTDAIGFFSFLGLAYFFLV
ncbi:MAG: magnesium transporter [Rickettsiaceae bacterium]|nr:magnesium transporter [Rickettsiaceae bacterium]